MLSPRNVIIDPDVEIITRKACIKEEGSVLLAINKEARKFAQDKLTSVFAAPRSRWEYTGRVKATDLRRALQALELPPACCVKNMLKAIMKHMNESVEGTDTFDFAKYQETSNDIIQPQWFNPKTDVLVYRYSSDPKLQSNDSLLWGPWRRGEAKKIQHLAFSVDALNTAARHYEGQSLWTRNGLKKSMLSSKPDANALEYVSVLVSDACEVLTFEVDREDLLKPGEWSFRLDTEDDRFRAEMGPRWASVVWRITLAKDEPKSTLWQLVKKVCKA